MMERPELVINDEQRNRLLNWFRENRRDLPWREEHRSPYTIWVSEVMLQQTRVDTVIPYYQRFMETYPDIETLARASEEEVLNLWEGLGFYARARNLHQAAKVIVEEHGGDFPASRDQLEELPGIGPSTAAAILSFAFQQQVPYLDGNVFRVISRYVGYAENTETAEGKQFIRAIVEESMSAEQPGVFNEALIELGAVVCTPSHPDCDNCPLGTECVARKEGIQEELPYRGKTRDVPTRTRTAVLIRSHGEILMVRRPSEGLLGGMWELPALWNEDDESVAETADRTATWAVGESGTVQSVDKTIRHTYSHFHLQMPLFELTVEDPASAEHEWSSKWCSPNQLQQIPIHKAAIKALQSLHLLDE